jgi:hypothetical protein
MFAEIAFAKGLGKDHAKGQAKNRLDRVPAPALSLDSVDSDLSEASSSMVGGGRFGRTESSGGEVSSGLFSSIPNGSSRLST